MNGETAENVLLECGALSSAHLGTWGIQDSKIPQRIYQGVHVWDTCIERYWMPRARRITSYSISLNGHKTHANGCLDGLGIRGGNGSLKG